MTEYVTFPPVLPYDEYVDVTNGNEVHNLTTDTCEYVLPFHLYGKRAVIDFSKVKTTTSHLAIEKIFSEIFKDEDLEHFEFWMYYSIKANTHMLRTIKRIIREHFKTR